MPTLEEDVQSLKGWRNDIAGEFRGLEAWRQKVEEPLNDLLDWHKENRDWLEVFRADLIYRQRKEAEGRKSRNGRNVVLGIMVTLYLALLQTIGTLVAINQMRGRG